MIILLFYFSVGAPEIDLSVLTIAPSTATQAPPPPSSENPNVKSLRKLEKKLKSIEELKVKRDKGVKLEKTQVSKIFYECGSYFECSL